MPFYPTDRSICAHVTPKCHYIIISVTWNPTHSRDTFSPLNRIDSWSDLRQVCKVLQVLELGILEQVCNLL